MKQYGLASLNLNQKVDLVNILYPRGYDCEIGDDGIRRFRHSKVEDRSTEPIHRCAVHAGEIREFKNQFRLYLANLGDPTLRQDQREILKALEFVLGRELPNHDNILFMLHK